MEILQAIYHFIFDPMPGAENCVMAWLPAFIAAAGYIISSAITASSQPEQQDQPMQQAGPLGSGAQTPPVMPFQPMGLPQQPNYQQQPAVTQFPQFQPLFPQGLPSLSRGRRIGQ